MPITLGIFYRLNLAYGELSNLLSEATRRQTRRLAEVIIENMVCRPIDVPAYGR